MADTKISALSAATTPLAGTEVLPIVQSGVTVKVAVSNLTAGRDIAATSLTTAAVQAASSAGGTLKNSGGTAQMQWGSGGGSNLSLEVATNINPANAAVNISPTGTGTVTINPATASTMNNVAIGGTTALAGRFTSVTATTGNIVIGTSGQGIDFSATPGTGTSELLADYEEGTWTPQYTNSTPPTTPYTMTITSATYTKIGRLVTVVAFIATSNVNTAGAAGTLRISGLPFTSAAHGVVDIGYSANWNVNFPSTGYVEAAATTIALQYRALANGATAALAPSDLTSGASAGQNSIMFTATYIV
jgi:hypothetical protein